MPKHASREVLERRKVLRAAREFEHAERKQSFMRRRKARKAREAAEVSFLEAVKRAKSAD